MKKIVVSEITDKMILGKPLIGGNGNILMAKGTELRENMKERLKSWGVVFAHIQTDDDEPGNETDKTMELEQLDKKFAGTLENSNMKTLYKEIRQHILGTD